LREDWKSSYSTDMDVRKFPTYGKLIKHPSSHYWALHHIRRQCIEKIIECAHHPNKLSTEQIISTAQFVWLEHLVSNSRTYRLIHLFIRSMNKIFLLAINQLKYDLNVTIWLNKLHFEYLFIEVLITDQTWAMVTTNSSGHKL